MMQFLLPLLVALALCGPDGLTDEYRLAYAPEEGSVLVREVRLDGMFQVESYEAFVNGEEVEGDPPDAESATFRRYVITDVIEAVGDGRPLRLQRRFDKLSRGFVEPGTQPRDDSPDARVTDLEGRLILVTWNDEDRRFVFKADDGEPIDELLLQHLAEDLDFRSFLPPGQVKEGDTWDLPRKAATSLTWTGGLLGFHGKGAALDHWFLEQELTNIDSAVVEGRAVFEGVRETDGRRLAAISFATKLSAGVSLVEEGETEETADYHWTTAETYAHEGTLLWDLDRRHMHSLRTTWKGRLSMDVGLIWKSEGQERKEEDRQVLRCEGTFAVIVRRGILGETEYEKPTDVASAVVEEQRVFPSMIPFTSSRMWPVMFGEKPKDFDIAEAAEMAKGMYEIGTYAEEVAGEYGPSRDEDGPSALLEPPMSDADKAWWSLVPAVMLRLEPLAARSVWGEDDLLVARQAVAFLTARKEVPNFVFRGGNHAANVEVLWKIAAWFRQQCHDPRHFAAMIFTFDDGPFVGLDWNTKTLLEPSERVALGKEIELRLCQVPDEDEPCIVQCIKEGKLLWSRRISDAPDCTVRTLRFWRKEPTDLGEYGWKVHMRAKWKYGSEYLHFYLDREGRFRFYFLAW